MSKLKINELKPAGIELFEDSENLMQELNPLELGQITGGTGIAVTEPYTNYRYPVYPRTLPTFVYEKLPPQAPIAYTPAIL
ncbi:hypothetical protein NIES4074_40190 [Cylindrospermum sp. NIES-4074]|nr:hypothetical protein NIES4074_40190 [Cylindrospermum sp. NIES-4074]